MYGVDGILDLYVHNDNKVSSPFTKQYNYEMIISSMKIYIKCEDIEIKGFLCNKC